MSAKESGPLGYGLVGCGEFGLFCLEQYGAMTEIRRVALADLDRERAERAAERFGLAACASVEELLARPDVDLVHIATPPAMHLDLVTAALRAGKHVLVEKPLAATMDQAHEMAFEAQRAGRVLAVNLVMRYDPLCAAVKKLVDEELLGEPLHAYFENYAKDEPLPPEHWFWDPEKSGGIFVEHGVHFFDLFSWWLGSGQVAASREVKRPGSGVVEAACCTALYGRVPVNFYHGFHQPERMDRQEMRLLFERGDVTLREWVPTGARIDCLADRATLERLAALLPGSETSALAEYSGEERLCSGRHKRLEADGRYQVRLSTGMSKDELYGHVLRELMADQVAAARDPNHRRRVTETDGVNSLHMAVEATMLARGGYSP